LEASDSITIRLREDATDSGYAWSDPVVVNTETDCVVLKEPNLGGSETTYKQFWFQARDSTDNCTSTITVTRLADNMPETFSVSVGRGSCDVAPCDVDGELRNLNLGSCYCYPLQTASGTVIDSSQTTIRSFDFESDEQFTLREWATAGTFTWSIPDISGQDCITLGDSFEDQWARYRQVSFTTLTADCRHEFVRFANTETGVDTTVTETLTVTVWPDVYPYDVALAAGLTLYDLDDAVPPTITVDAGTSFLTQVSEIDNFPNGYLW